MTMTQQETALFVYGVVPGDRDVPDGLTGVDGGTVELVPFGSVAAVVSTMSSERPPGRRADLTAYSDVIEALAPDGPVAPMRFGTVVSDHDVLVHDVLGPRADELAQQLAELEGQRQYHLRVTYVEEAVLTEIAEADPRVRHLREATRDLPEDASVGERIKLGELVTRSWEQWAHADADRILAELVPMLSTYRVRREPGLGAVLDLALLVDDQRSQEVEDRLEAMAAEAAGRIRFRLAGPMAPYDFVGSG
jgi:Gas vesicle synthesis protein GvpL/GvpF